METISETHSHFRRVFGIFLFLSLMVSMAKSSNCERVEVTGTLVWGPSWNWYKLCKPNDQGCKHCPKGHSRVFCHQQPQSYDYDSFDSDNDQPVVCAVCFNGHNFYGPECTTN